MKKMLLLLLILILSVVSATEISAPKELPANLNWSFSVELNPSNNFTETKIYFDDLLIVTAYNDKNPIIQEDFVLKAFVFDKNPEDNSGLTVFVSYFGIDEGIHLIKTKSKINYKSFSILSYPPFHLIFNFECCIIVI